MMPSAVSLRPALAAGTKARIRYLFRLTTGTEVLARSAALRCGVPGFTVEWVCIVEVSTLRRPSGACRRDAACAVTAIVFLPPSFWGTPKKRPAEKQRGSDIKHNGSLCPHALPFRQVGCIMRGYV
ncbi:hypothetical protein NXW94_19680 [Bacteroides ovatus]|nr:hypothetical protein [Bacteroides ovatus]